MSGFEAADADDDARLLRGDLEAIVERGRDDFTALRGARVFMTGGTGFVGSWLLESFTWANRRLALGARATILTRDAAAFAGAAPHLASDTAIEFVTGDVRDGAPLKGSFDAMIHAATPASATFNETSPASMVDTVVDGMRRVLTLAQRNGAIPVLFTSSGAVYGRQPPDLELVEESYFGGPDPLDPRNAYHESKRLAELLCSIAGATTSIRPKIARLFAFVGPYLPLDRHFAIGNFIRDAISGSSIDILGDGTPVRTYLYGADMTSWLWRILMRGTACRAYNVGSERTVSIADSARLVARAVTPHARLKIHAPATPGKPVERYACSTARARAELELVEWTSLEDGIRRTIGWHRARRC